MADRWNVGKPEIGASFHPGFVSPWNDNVREWADFERIQTIPETMRPATMEGQMDGDQNIGFGGGGGGGRRGRR